MGKFGKILAGASVGIVALAVAGIAILKTIDINQHKVAIADRVKAATGRDLVLGGDMELDISLQPVLVLKDVGFANPPGMSRPVMATLQRLEARVELLALLKVCFVDVVHFREKVEAAHLFDLVNGNDSPGNAGRRFYSLLFWSILQNETHGFPF